MSNDIVDRIREDCAASHFDEGSPCCLYGEAADEIERLREWAAYEHAGYCECAGGNPECLKRAYKTWGKVMRDE